MAVAHLGIFEHDHETDQLYWSPTLREIFDVGAEEPASLTTYLDRIHPDDRPTVLASVERGRNPTRDGTHAIEHRLVHRDGSIR